MELICGNCKHFDETRGYLDEGECTASVPYWIVVYQSIGDPYRKYNEKRASICECFEAKEDDE